MLGGSRRGLGALGGAVAGADGGGDGGGGDGLAGRDLEGLRFHDLRHTAVALAIGQGAHPKAIQERMGHSSITTTLDRYGHLFPSLDEQIAEGLDAVWRQVPAASSRPGGGLTVVGIDR